MNLLKKYLILSIVFLFLNSASLFAHDPINLLYTMHDHEDRIYNLEKFKIRPQIKTMFFENERMKFETYVASSIYENSTISPETGFVFTVYVGKTYAQKIKENQELEIKNLKFQLEKMQHELKNLRNKDKYLNANYNSHTK